MTAMSQYDAEGQPSDRQAASFLVERQPWMEASLCKTMTDLFYEGEDENDEPVPIDTLECQRVCAHCAVRVECGTQILFEEGNARVEDRHGFRAYMTPGQRESVSRRGGLLGRDPMYVVNGVDGERLVPAVPLEGDGWNKHYSQLMRRTQALLEETLWDGEPVPVVKVLAKIMDVNPTPLRKVLDALVQSGVLNYGGEVSQPSYTMGNGSRH